MKFRVVVATLLILLSSVSPASSILNGSTAVGSEYVVTMLFGDDKVGNHCTGAYFRPRVVVTAAHCVIKQGGRAPELTRPIGDWYVSQPGIDWTTPEARTSKVKVIKIWTDPDYFNRWEPDKGLRETQVNDVAFLFLESELKGPHVTRAATREEIEAFRFGKGRAFHLGYGCIGQSWEERKNNDGKPYLASEIIGTNQGSLSTPIWDRFLLAQYDLGKGETCSGDSGSPLLMKKDGDVLYLGTIFAGGNGSNGIKFAATTVLWPFVPALDKAYTEFLTEDAKNRELKAKQEAETKAANDKAATDKIIQDAKIEADKSIQDAKLEAEKIISDAKLEAEKIIADAKVAADMVAASTRKVTITCTKGKLTKKVTAVKPKCPSGYKVKK
jgi:hypothetical protein